MIKKNERENREQLIEFKQSFHDHKFLIPNLQNCHSWNFG